MQTKINGVYVIKKRWMRGLLSHECLWGNLKISGVYVIEKR